MCIGDATVNAVCMRVTIQHQIHTATHYNEHHFMFGGSRRIVVTTAEILTLLLGPCVYLRLPIDSNVTRLRDMVHVLTVLRLPDIVCSCELQLGAETCKPCTASTFLSSVALAIAATICPSLLLCIGCGASDPVCLKLYRYGGVACDGICWSVANVAYIP